MAGRNASVPSEIDELEKLNDGASTWSILPTSVWPVACIESALSVSTGTARSDETRPAWRVPSVTISSISSSLSSANAVPYGRASEIPVTKTAMAPAGRADFFR